MSHSVTITRTTTSTTNTSYIVLNTGYIKTFPGILKLFQLVSDASRQLHLDLIHLLTAFIAHWHCCGDPDGDPLPWQPLLSWRAGLVPLPDGHHIHDRDILFIPCVPHIAEHGRAHRQDNLCKCLAWLLHWNPNRKLKVAKFLDLQELIYHSVAAILLLASSVCLLIKLRDGRNDSYMAAPILGLVNTVLYFISAFLAHRSYRGI